MYPGYNTGCPAASSPPSYTRPAPSVHFQQMPAEEAPPKPPLQPGILPGAEVRLAGASCRRWLLAGRPVAAQEGFLSILGVEGSRQAQGLQHPRLGPTSAIDPPLGEMKRKSPRPGSQGKCRLEQVA